MKRLRGNLSFLFFLAILGFKLFHSTGGVNQLLFAGKERVAAGANLHVDVFDGGPGLNHIPAGAGNGGLVIFGVYAFFH